MAAKMWGEAGSSAGGKNGAEKNLDGLGRSWTFLDVLGCSWMGRRKSLDESANNAAGKGTDTPTVTSEAPVFGPLRSMYQPGESARKKNGNKRLSIVIKHRQALLDRCRGAKLFVVLGKAVLACPRPSFLKSSTFAANKSVFCTSLPAVGL